MPIDVTTSSLLRMLLGPAFYAPIRHCTHHCTVAYCLQYSLLQLPVIYTICTLTNCVLLKMQSTAMHCKLLYYWTLHCAATYSALNCLEHTFDFYFVMVGDTSDD